MGGWFDKSFHYMSCALSCLKLSEFYPVELITDTKGKDIFVEKIGLPFQKTRIDLEKIDYPTELWAIAKIIAYNLQTEPFLHIDNDIFIWSELPEHIIKSNLVVQSIEEGFNHNRQYVYDITNKFKYIPSSILDQKKNKTNIDSINAGIIGGNNLNFIKEYSREAINFIEQNRSCLQNITNIKGFNLVFEQCLFYCMAIQKNEKITCLLDKRMNLEYRELVQFWEVPNINTYIHAIASYKEHYVIGEQIAQRLWYEYPEYFYRIKNLIKRNAI